MYTAMAAQFSPRTPLGSQLPKVMRPRKRHSDAARVIVMMRRAGLCLNADCDMAAGENVAKNGYAERHHSIAN